MPQYPFDKLTDKVTCNGTSFIFPDAVGALFVAVSGAQRLLSDVRLDRYSSPRPAGCSDWKAHVKTGPEGPVLLIEQI